MPLSSSSTPPKRYDVFLSFRGEDTRRSFTGHLYDALTHKGLYSAFMDDEGLHKSKDIARQLMKAIEESRFAIVVLSENYASSTWCLTELMKIVECLTEQILPIFYHVDPSHVRKQSGSYADAFKTHRQNCGPESREVRSWSEALTTVANLSGWHVHDSIRQAFLTLSHQFLVYISCSSGLINSLFLIP